MRLFISRITSTAARELSHLVKNTVSSNDCDKQAGSNLHRNLLKKEPEHFEIPEAMRQYLWCFRASGLEQGGKHSRMTEVQQQTKRSLEPALVVNGREVRESWAKISIIVGLLLNLKASFSNSVLFLGSCTTTLKALSIEMINLWRRFMHIQIKSGNQSWKG